MPKEFPRSRRVGEQIHRELMDLLRREVKDPRVSGVTITAVRVSRDLAHARVFFTLLDEKHTVEEAGRALKGAAGFLRRELAGIMMLRTVPELRFVHDTSIEHAAHMEELIGRAVAADRAKHGDDDND